MTWIHCGHSGCPIDRCKYLESSGDDSKAWNLSPNTIEFELRQRIFNLEERLSKLEKETKKRALDELTKLTEESGGYEELLKARPTSGDLEERSARTVKLATNLPEPKPITDEALEKLHEESVAFRDALDKATKGMSRRTICKHCVNYHAIPHTDYCEYCIDELQEEKDRLANRVKQLEAHIEAINRVVVGDGVSTKG